MSGRRALRAFIAKLVLVGAFSICGEAQAQSSVFQARMKFLKACGGPHNADTAKSDYAPNGQTWRKYLESCRTRLATELRVAKEEAQAANETVQAAEEKVQTRKDCLQDDDRERQIAGCTKWLAEEPPLEAELRAEVYAIRGSAYVSASKFDEAIADFDEAIQLNPREPRVFARRGTALERRGDRARARTDFEAALALDSDNAAAKEGLARLAKTDSAPSGAPIVATQSCSSLGRRIALVVGNSAYAGSARLINPANDADDVTALLRDKLCFTVIEVKDATREIFSRKIGEFAEAASGAEVALFYYAGHGAQFQNANYFLPVDSKMANEYDAIHGNISAQDLIATIETRAKATLVFLDACRDNPIEEDFRRRMASAGRGFGDTRGLAPMTGRSSETLVVFATRPNERAADGAGRNSPFTQAFLEHIATPAKDIELVMRDVAASVRAKTNGRQIPQRLTELEHGLMLLPAR